MGRCSRTRHAGLCGPAGSVVFTVSERKDHLPNVEQQEDRNLTNLLKFHIYVLVYCIGLYLSGLLHSV